MKRAITISLLLALTLYISAQSKPDCEPVVFSRLDSVINYVINDETGEFVPADVYIYGYETGEPNQVIRRLSLPSRTPVNRQLYYDNEYGLKIMYILQVWNGTEYINSSRTDYTYNPDDYLASELFSRYEAEAWVNYQQHLYNYNDEMKVTTYLRQMMYSPGVWTNFSYKNYIYNEQGELEERNEQRISDGVIFWAEVFTYDEFGRVSVRIRQGLKYDPVTRSYLLVDLNRQKYTYSKYGELSEYLIESWDGGEWVLTGKSIYFRKLLLFKKVPVCFNGHTMMVPVKMALRLLDYGALLGSCECLYPEGFPCCGECDKSSGRKGNDGLMIYPNPAVSEINVITGEKIPGNREISIYSQNGTLMKRTSSGSAAETVDISDLRSGSYYLVVSGAGVSLTTTFVKKQ